MIEIKKKLKDFICIFNILEKLCIETDVSFLPDKIYIRAVHPSNHCFIIFSIKKDFFEKYDIKEEKTYTLDLQMLNKVLKTVGKKSLIIEESEDKVIFSNGKDKFEINYFVGKRDKRPKPDFKSTSKWRISPPDAFFNTTSGLMDFSGVCKFGGTDMLELHTKSNLVQGTIILECKKIESNSCYAFYDLTYIDLIKDIKNIFKEIKLGFSKDNPIIIKGENEYVNFEFILAGRVE